MSDNTTSTISTSKGISYPNESTEYRIARNQLLEQEMGLRRQLEAVALIRRGLPLGGLVSTDYVFTNGSGALSLSDMFESGKDVLAVYSFMHSPDMAEPCMGCTHLLDALDGSAQHFEQRLNFQVVAKSP